GFDSHPPPPPSAPEIPRAGGRAVAGAALRRHLAVIHALLVRGLVADSLLASQHGGMVPIARNDGRGRQQRKQESQERETSHRKAPPERVSLAPSGAARTPFLALGLVSQWRADPSRAGQR